MIRPKTIAINTGGQRWTGTWHLDGKDVCVSSAYGSARAALGRAQPERKAAALLGEVVAAWRAR